MPTRSALTEQPWIQIGTTSSNNKPRTWCCLQDLNRKNERSKAMPSLGGFLSHQQVWNGPDFDPGGKYQFYPTTVWGAEADGAHLQQRNRHHKVKQAEIALKQVEVNRTATEQRLATAEQSRSQARTAFDNFRTEERSLKLSKEHLRSHEHQVHQRCCGQLRAHPGTGQLPHRPTDLHPTLVELLMARADLRKALDLY
jgi:hypothetical protein